MENELLVWGKLVAVVGGVSHQYFVCSRRMPMSICARTLNQFTGSFVIFFSRILLSLLLFICYFIGSAYLFKAN